MAAYPSRLERLRKQLADEAQAVEAERESYKLRARKYSALCAFEKHMITVAYGAVGSSRFNAHRRYQATLNDQMRQLVNHMTGITPAIVGVDPGDPAGDQTVMTRSSLSSNGTIKTEHFTAEQVYKDAESPHPFKVGDMVVLVDNKNISNANRHRVTLGREYRVEGTTRWNDNAPMIWITSDDGTKHIQATVSRFEKVEVKP